MWCQLILLVPDPQPRQNIEGFGHGYGNLEVHRHSDDLEGDLQALSPYEFDGDLEVRSLDDLAGFAPHNLDDVPDDFAWVLGAPLGFADFVRAYRDVHLGYMCRRCGFPW